MKVYPLKSISIEEAMNKQFRFVDCMTRNFNGYMSLSRGDLGVKQPNNEPDFTIQAEKTIADFFNQEACILVRGSGTGAIRYGLSSMIKPGELLMVHDAPVYSTTVTSIEMFGLNTIKANFNNPDDVISVLQNNDIKAILIQHTRQVPEDSYNLGELIKLMKSVKDLPIIIDE
ncbi:MAG: aminotransferase, partial [Erysipelotrichaceae bacterium]|nr:aminotransferase [Erysipelotrichaceae bacterium]